MLECERQNLSWRWIYAAQHKETMETSIKIFQLPPPDYTIVKWQTEAKTMSKVWFWFFKMLIHLPRSHRVLDNKTGKQHIVLTHGDTLTTWLGALFGRLTRTNVMHVESGLRSFNLLRPFPEEINRLITFRLSNYYAAPGKWALRNLQKYKGVKINTTQNTQIDTLRYGLERCENTSLILPKKKYVVASIHRYENIFKAKRFEEIIDRLEDIAKDFEILFVQHPATKIQIEKLSLHQRLEQNKNIILLPRLEFLDFIKAIKHAEFVVADGGGNQEELYHLGKPTLLFRNETERQEGIGETVVVSKLDPKIIKDFVKNYKKYQREPVAEFDSPSKIIVDELASREFGR